MELLIQTSGRIPIYEQIVQQIQQQILDGTLQENTRLPSVRQIAREYQISALTAKKAYDQLEEKGLIQVVQGKGSFVLKPDRDLVEGEAFKKVEAALEDVIILARGCRMPREHLEKIFFQKIKQYEESAGSSE